jgi:hypothetical protein
MNNYLFVHKKVLQIRDRSVYLSSLEKVHDADGGEHAQDVAGVGEREVGLGEALLHLLLPRPQGIKP